MAETKRNPPWTRDELLVALDYYLDNPDDYFSPTGKGVLDLTAKISQVAKALGLTGLRHTSQRQRRVYETPELPRLSP